MADDYAPAVPISRVRESRAAAENSTIRHDVPS
jgi:hypothetical protein